jgi:2-methylcitrate dehydratase PrpD
VHAQEVEYPDGHSMNPMSDDAVVRKFRGMLKGHAIEERCEQILERLWRFETLADVGSDALALFSARSDRVG